MVLNQAQAAVVDGTPEITFWDRRLILGDAVIVDGECYYIGDFTTKRDALRGFGGARWRICFFDGRELCTSNLWHNGTVPPTHRNALPDNATLESVVEPITLPGDDYHVDW